MKGNKMIINDLTEQRLGDGKTIFWIYVWQSGIWSDIYVGIDRVIKMQMDAAVCISN